MISISPFHLTHGLLCPPCPVLSDVMSPVFPLCTNAANRHLISPAEEIQRLFIMKTPFSLDFTAHIYELMSIHGIHFVVLPAILLTEGNVAGQAGLHGSNFATNFTDHLSVFKQKSKRLISIGIAFYINELKFSSYLTYYHI